ncbi:Copper amine oxidase N-terminal domain-containing protein [Sporosarcina sp. ANT_H38]
MIGIFIFEPFRSEPPTPNVTIGDVDIPTTQGSYCWKRLLSAQCVDKAYTSLFDMASRYKPTVVSPNEKIKIEFKKKPIAGTMKVEQWVDEDNKQKVEVKNGSIVVPLEKGVYVYSVLSDWKQGDGMYAFSVEVK